jgi:hypothetical protein
MTNITRIFLLISFYLISCTTRIEKESEPFKKYYLFSSEDGYWLSKSDTIDLEYSKNEGNLLDSMEFFYYKSHVKIFKYSNYPNELIDAGYVSYYEKSLGVFYLKGTSSRNFLVLETNNDSINGFIDLLMGNVLTSSKMFMDPRQIERIKKMDSIEFIKYNKNSH